MRRIRIILALVGIALVATPTTAHAACDASATARLGSARAVFVGTVTEVSNGSRDAVVEVEWVWKGRGIEETVLVHGTSADEASGLGNDRSFQVGVKYLIASRTSQQPYVADLCTATRTWQGAGSIIPVNLQNEVGTAAPTLPEPVTQSVADQGSLLDSAWWPIAMGALLVVGIGFGLNRVLRGPGHVSGRAAGDKRRNTKSRLPSGGRSPENLNSRFRRSGASQADKLRRSKRNRRQTKKVAQKRAARAGRSAPDADPAEEPSSVSS